MEKDGWEIYSSFSKNENSLMNKKILILGVTGQDGSLLADYLTEKKYQVFGLIRKSVYLSKGFVKYKNPSSSG